MRVSIISAIVEGRHEMRMLPHFGFEQHTKDACWLIVEPYGGYIFHAYQQVLCEQKGMCQGSKKRIKVLKFFRRDK